MSSIEQVVDEGLNPGQAPALTTRAARAFSLVEVLLAIFILGIGLIMVASVFPVGADWTRQTTEDSMGRVIAQTAEGVIRGHYPRGGYLTPTNLQGGVLAPFSPFQLQALPYFADTTVPPVQGGPPAPALPLVPLAERAYQFGASRPFPAANPAACNYFWTALVRLSPTPGNMINPSLPPSSANVALGQASYTYDLYILVFRKGAVEVPFKSSTLLAGQALIPGACDPAAAGAGSAAPTVAYSTYSPGISTLSPPVLNAIPDIGGIGIGAISGTVFRQGVAVLANGTMAAEPRPKLCIVNNNSYEPIIIAPAAAGTTASPLIYVYQTTLTQ